MSRNRNRFPRPNNSGRYREPTNVWAKVPQEDYPVALRFYEDELQELARDFPSWIIFVKEEVPDAGMGES